MLLSVLHQSSGLKMASRDVDEEVLDLDSVIFLIVCDELDEVDLLGDDCCDGTLVSIGEGGLDDGSDLPRKD
jgi:hypothetical protein